MKERIITGVFGGIIFLSLLYFSGKIFASFIFLLAFIGFNELLKMAKINNKSLISVVSFGLSVIVFLPYWTNIEWIDKQTVFILLLLSVLLYVVFSSNKSKIQNAGVIFLGFFYVVFGFSYFLESRLENNFIFVLFILLLIWVTDSGAYFVGKSIGKRKLFERISPNKTIEGSLGGVFVAVIFSIIFFYSTHLLDNVFYAILLALIVSVAGQIGDLVESALKREFSVKDSGNLLPGHGGVLDRFDSLLFVFPILYVVHLL